MRIGTSSCCFLFIALFLSEFLVAQPGAGYEGNALSGFLGKNVTDREVKGLLANFNFEMVNEAHYLSKQGIELIVQKTVLNEINIYKSSAVYGNFKGSLPDNLRFGLSPGEVKKLLGKPLVSYSSGYCEFELRNYLLSCWFDNGLLSQVGLAVKSGM